MGNMKSQKEAEAGSAVRRVADECEQEEYRRAVGHAVSAFMRGVLG